MNDEAANTDYPTEIVNEGNVRFLVPRLQAFMKSPSDYAPSKAPVFYNPVMELNRDLAVLAARAYRRVVDHGVTICEALAGCGAMGIRFGAEVAGVSGVIMADINEKAASLTRENIRINGLAEKVSIEHGDANLLLCAHSAPHNRFDVIDIDPFGSPVTYVDSAIRALRNCGLLALTATDMAPLCGVHPKACIRKYGGRPLRTEYSHELAVRLLVGSLATAAARYDMGTDVVFSHSSNHYVRVYARIQYGARRADESVGKIGYILHCFACLHRETRKKPFVDGDLGRCVECGSRLSFAGPLWLGEIADEQFVRGMKEEASKHALRLNSRIARLLDLVEGECNAPVTYYSIDSLCSKLHLPVPPLRSVIDRLQKEGFTASPTHFDPNAVKSDVPAMRIGEVILAVAKRNR